MDSLNAFGKQQRLIGSVSFVQTMCYSVYLNTVFALTSYVHPLVRTGPFNSLTVRIHMIIQDILFVLRWYQAFQNKNHENKKGRHVRRVFIQHEMRAQRRASHRFHQKFETRAAVPKNNSLIRLYNTSNRVDFNTALKKREQLVCTCVKSRPG